MNDKLHSNGTTALDSSLAASGQQASGSEANVGFIRRYRMPLFLAVVAVCLYLGSILYILFGRGQIV